MRLEGKTALITGSDQGIGRGVAVRYAQEGAEVIINYRQNSERAGDALKELEATGGKGLILQADVSKIEEVRRLVDQSIAHFGKLDILVNNAGIEKRAAFADATEEDYLSVIAVNQTGPYFAVQQFVRHLRDTKRPGKIINMSSVHEELPFPHFTSYCMSKGALKMMMRNLAVELGPMGITVNNIAPGAIQTPINTKLLHDPSLLNALVSQIPLGRLGTVEDVAGLAVFLASSDSDYMTGSTFFVDGGLLWDYHEQ